MVFSITALYRYTSSKIVGIKAEQNMDNVYSINSGAKYDPDHVQGVDMKTQIYY